jgi:hypothetical protein
LDGVANIRLSDDASDSVHRTLLCNSITAYCSLSSLMSVTILVVALAFQALPLVLSTYSYLVDSSRI